LSINQFKKGLQWTLCFIFFCVWHQIYKDNKFYRFLGTMADYNYQETSGLEISVSLSCCKAVEASTFVDEWENNKESLYKYIEAVHLGIKGVVTKGGQPLPYAWVQVKDEKKAFHTSDRSNERGEYWRVVVPGDYTVVALDGG